MIWKEWVAVHQKDVCFLLVLFYWPCPVINLRIAKNTWDNGWLLFRTLIYFYCTVTVGKCLSYFSSFVLPRERISPCVLLQKSSVVFQCMHINSSCHYAEYWVSSSSDEAITKACHVYLTDQHHRARNAINSQTLFANHRTVGHQWPSAFSFLIGSGLGLPAWLFCVSTPHLKNGHSFIFPPSWKHLEGKCTDKCDLLGFFEVWWKIGVFILFLC